MKSYSFVIETQKSSKEVYQLLLEIEKWWSGIYDETIVGESKNVNDEFTFSAGKGMHFSKQKLIEQTPYQKIVWQVVESHLSFLENPREWELTKLQFEIVERAADSTQIKFTHEGLTPEFECYDGCSTAWTQYLNNLQTKLK